MMRRTMILALAIAGCNGGGESTTAAETVNGTGTTGTPEETGNPVTDTGNPVTDTGMPGTSESGEPGTGESTAADTTAGEETTAGTTTGECPEVELVGEWLSEGENVAPLLVQVLNLTSVQATFEEVTYVVTSTDGDGAMYEQTGTWTSELCPGSDTKYRIVLEQTAPSALTAEGIYEVDNCMDPALMRYEVIQTMPDLGAPAPTCDDDFGTGPFGTDNIQIFIRQ
jgi:hypothetical protein